MPSASSGDTTSNSTGRVVRQRVGLEGRRALEAEGRPPLPVGPEGVAGRDLHEGGEGLVQPDAVPPLHRHEVAEPHVGELVGDDVGDVLQLGLGGRRRVDEQDALAEGDAAEVLHGPGGEVGQRRRGRPCRPGRGCRSSPGTSAGRTAPTSRAKPVRCPLPGHVDEAQRDAVDVDRVGDLERPDDEGDEVGRHGHRVGEADARGAPSGRASRGDLRPVGDGQEVVGRRRA